MTTIAFDGTFLAVDRAGWIASGVPYEVDKLFHLVNNPGDWPWGNARAWYVGAGGQGDASAIKQWLQGRSARPHLPEDNRYGLVVTEHAFIYQVTRYAELVLTYTCPWADGAGMDFALGAMHAGKSAPQAIELCARYTTWAAIGMDYVNVHTGDTEREFF